MAEAEDTRMGDDDDDEEEEDDNTAGDLDFDDIADKAVREALKGTRADPGSLSLDVGLDASQLYLRGSKLNAFNTAAVPGRSTLDPADFASGIGTEAPKPSAQGREVRGAPVRPVNDKTLRKKKQRLKNEQSLDKWYGLQKRKMTPELEKELKAIKLRANFDPKRFYKSNDSWELPKYFAVATEVGGGLAAAGVSAPATEGRHGRSFLDSLLRDEKAQAWTDSRAAEVRSRGDASVNSGHGKVQKQHAGTKGKLSTHRGGAWKKKKKS